MSGEAVGFVDASNQYLESESISVGQCGTFDLWASCWFKPLTSPSVAPVLTKDDFTANRGWSIIRLSTALYFYWHANGSSYLVNALYGAPLNSYTFVLAYYDYSSGQIGFAVNGRAIRTASAPGTPVAKSVPIRIGTESGNPARAFNGSICEACVGSPSTSVAGLAESIRASLYNGGRGKSYGSLAESEKAAWGLQSYWPLGESGGVRRDVHARSNLLPINGPTWAHGIDCVPDPDPPGLGLTLYRNRLVSGDDLSGNLQSLGM